MHDRSISCGTEFFALAIIVAVATAFRFWNLNWDQGFLLHPDEFNLVAASSRLKGYGSNPDFFAYNGLGLFLPPIATEVWSLLTWTDVNPRSLSTLSYASRFISAFLSTATVVLAWRVARVVFGPSVGLLPPPFLPSMLRPFSPLTLAQRKAH